MAYALTEVLFNHGGSLATSSIPLRRSCDAAVQLPEWKAGDGDATTRSEPVAYAASEVRGHDVTIWFTLRRRPDDPRSVVIFISEEVRAGGGGELKLFGEFRPIKAEFKGQNRVVRVPAKFYGNRHNLADVGIGIHEVEWTWHAQAVGVERHPIAVTLHRVLTVLEAPQEPWDAVGDSTRTPWLGVIERSCAWASGARTRSQAITLVCRGLRALGRIEHADGTPMLSYEQSLNFISPVFGHLMLDRFLERLENRVEHAMPGLVNCSDCAAILTAFVNVLGCDVYQLTLGVQGEHRVEFFDVLPHVPIGSRNSLHAAPRFQYHELVCAAAGTDGSSAWDFCLEPVDPEQPATDVDLVDPEFEQRTISLADVRLVEARTQIATQEYHDTCRQILGGNRRRAIVRPRTRPHTMCEPPTGFEDVHDFGSWNGDVRVSEIDTHVRGLYLRPRVFHDCPFKDFKPVPGRLPGAWPPRTQQVSWMRETGNGRRQVVATLDVAECESRRSARVAALRMALGYAEDAVGKPRILDSGAVVLSVEDRASIVTQHNVAMHLRVRQDWGANLSVAVIELLTLLADLLAPAPEAVRAPDADAVRRIVGEISRDEPRIVTWKTRNARGRPLPAVALLTGGDLEHGRAGLACIMPDGFEGVPIVRVRALTGDGRRMERTLELDQTLGGDIGLDAAQL